MCGKMICCAGSELWRRRGGGVLVLVEVEIGGREDVLDLAVGVVIDMVLYLCARNIVCVCVCCFGVWGWRVRVCFSFSFSLPQVTLSRKKIKSKNSNQSARSFFSCYTLFTDPVFRHILFTKKSENRKMRKTGSVKSV